MKGVVKYILRAGAVVSLVGTFQGIALYAFLSMTISLPPEKMGLLIRYGVPVIVVLLFLFLVSIPLIGLPILKFVAAHDKGETYTDEELREVQKRLVNYPYQIGVSAFLFWFVSSPIMAAILSILGVLNFEQACYGVIGGIIGAALVAAIFDIALIILSAAAGAALISYQLMQSTSLEQIIIVVIFIVLFVIGVVIQRSFMRREK